MSKSLPHYNRYTLFKSSTSQKKMLFLVLTFSAFGHPFHFMLMVSKSILRILMVFIVWETNKVFFFSKIYLVCRHSIATKVVFLIQIIFLVFHLPQKVCVWLPMEFYIENRLRDHQYEMKRVTKG